MTLPIRASVPAILVALFLAGCGSNSGTPSAPTATDTPVATSTPQVRTEAGTPSPLPEPPTPEPVTNPLHVVDLGTGADGIQFVNATGPFTWSPDSTLLAVASQNELAIVRLADGNVRITKLQVFGEPTWSPDSRYLALPQVDALLVVEGDTGKAVATMERRTSEPVMGWTYDWAPDGRLAAASLAGPVRVWDGDQVRELDAIAFRLWWLEDGRLAVLEASSEKGPGVLEILDPEAAYAAQTSIPVEGNLFVFGVSPSGRYAVEVDDAAWPESTLHVVALDSGNQTGTIAASAFGYPSAPVVFQPGTDNFLVLTNLCEEDPGLALASPDGSLAPIADAFVFVAAFSPDGTEVAYTTGQELWLVPVAGGTPRLLAEGVHGPAGLAWSPDGTRIAYAPYFGGFGACD